MLNESTYLQFDLEAGTPVSLWKAEDCEVHCIQGRVWITEEDGGGDIILESGERFRLTRPGQTIVEASDEAAAQCRLYRTQKASHAGRLGSWLHAWGTGLTIGNAMAKGQKGHGVGFAAVF